MSQLKKMSSRRKPDKHRCEPTPADSSDELSDTAHEQLKKVAASKDKKDEQWELIHGPAW